jgi:hypothetical protein
LSGIYNGEDIGLGACDPDLDPLNGCFDSTSFSTPTADCAGIPAGDSLEDDCGVCDGGNASMDDCGVCDGDSSSCSTESASVTYNTATDLYGFQFVVTGATLVSAGGGDAEAAGFTVSSSSSSGVVLGFHLEERSFLPCYSPPYPAEIEPPSNENPRTTPEEELDETVNPAASASPPPALTRVAPVTTN